MMPTKLPFDIILCKFLFHDLLIKYEYSGICPFLTNTCHDLPRPITTTERRAVKPRLPPHLSIITEYSDRDEPWATPSRKLVILALFNKSRWYGLGLGQTIQHINCMKLRGRVNDLFLAFIWVYKEMMLILDISCVSKSSPLFDLSWVASLE